MTRKKDEGRKGFVLVTAILIISILIIILTPYIARVSTEYRLMSKIYNSTAALDLAEAGIERGIWEVKYNGSAFTGWTTTVAGDGSKTSTLNVNGFQTSSGRAIGDYTVVVWTSPDETSSTTTATGYVPNRNAIDEKRIIKVAFSRHNFSKAVVGLGNITMSGQAKTDSYNSTLGSYASQPHTENGDMITNGSINLSGQAYIHGDANPGPGHPFSGHPNVSGSYGTLAATFTVDPIPAETINAARDSNSNANIVPPITGTSLSVSGSDVVTLPGGTYYFTSISVSGQAGINVTGPSTIYVDGGNVSISGQGIVNNGVPKNLLLYSTGNNISLSGQAAFTGAIYAPSATVTLTGQENLYGSITCGTNVDSGQAAIHFDLDLMNVTPVFADNKVTSWQEIKQ
jgi:hypothetical protein